MKWIEFGETVFILDNVFSLSKESDDQLKIRSSVRDGAFLYFGSEAERDDFYENVKVKLNEK